MSELITSLSFIGNILSYAMKQETEAGNERVKEDTVGAHTAELDIRFIADEKTARSNPLP